MKPRHEAMNRLNHPAAVRLGVMILGAGRSSRMGRPKLLLPWGETSVVGHLLAVWRRLGARQVTVVLAAGDGLLSGELDRLGVAAEDRVVNHAPDRGMFSSIQCGAGWDGWQAGLSHWAIVLGDQPHLRLGTLRRLLRLAGANPESVCQPASAGRPRHPVLLPRGVFRALAVSQAPHLESFLAGRACASYASTDPGLTLDLDRPGDYQAARNLSTPARWRRG